MRAEEKQRSPDRCFASENYRKVILKLNEIQKTMAPGDAVWVAPFVVIAVVSVLVLGNFLF